ncbi:MAG: peptidase U32 [Lentisphaerae bacterium GWF2_50_93]|nr:MAG: peptidase U32 [Lentisphaerae bacterium GWF2_50_93]
MKFSLAANYDPEIVPELAHCSVEEVYGKFPADGVSGGRPRYMSSPVSGKALRNYVGLLSRHGIAFNYLLNGSCMGNREWTRAWQKNLMKLLDSLGGMGIKRLTISTPYLLELVKKRFPEFKVKVGIYAQVDTPERARFWEELGADGITLESFSINRDFRRLRGIRKAVRCELQLIANHLCLPNCPMQPYHQNGFAHASDEPGTLFIDYCFLRCSRKRLEDPSLFIKSGWIRPEDLGSYAEIGYTRFKLLERGIPSSELLKRAKAYSEGRSVENLAELLLSHGFREPQQKESFWALRNFFKPLQASPSKLKPLLDLARQQGMLFPLKENPVRIDSRMIPENFLDAFKDKDCISLDCAECGYCAKIAEKAVVVSPEFRRESLSRFSELEKNLAEGKFWNA